MGRRARKNRCWVLLVSVVALLAVVAVPGVNLRSGGLTGLFCTCGGGGGGGGGPGPTQTIYPCLAVYTLQGFSATKGPVVSGNTGPLLMSSNSYCSGGDTNLNVSTYPVSDITNEEDCLVICSPVGGAASFTTEWWANDSATFTDNAGTTTDGSAGANFSFYMWDAESTSLTNGLGCAYGDNAGGSALLFVNVVVKNSAGSVISPNGNFPIYTAQESSCTATGTGEYLTGDLGIFPTSSSFDNLGWSSLTFTKGDSYTVEVVIGCSFTGFTSGNNMDNDQDTQAASVCGPSYLGWGAAWGLEVSD
jgi:hypothetical protein